MSTEVGRALRETRLRKGLDLYEAHRVTKIRVESLRAMEEGRWEVTPGSEGEEQLAAYARFLGLEGPLEPPEPVGREPRTGWGPGGALLVIGVAAAVGLLIAVVALRPLGGSGGSNTPEATAPGATGQATTTVASAPVSIEITTHALVWVCLVDSRGRPVIDGLNLVRDQTVGPYNGRGFEVTFGNGKVDLTVNGRSVVVPDIAAPLGYKIRPDGATRLPPPEQPVCT